MDMPILKLYSWNRHGQKFGIRNWLIDLFIILLISYRLEQLYFWLFITMDFPLDFVIRIFENKISKQWI